MQTPEHFKSLASTLLALRAPAPQEPGLELVEEMMQQQSAAASALDEAPSAEELEMVRAVKLFHARIIEAVEAAVERLAAGIAREILGRELALAPAQIENIVDDALRRFASSQPLRIRVHEKDARSLPFALPVVVDPNVCRGDAIIELRDGEVDLSLSARLAALLQRAP